MNDPDPSRDDAGQIVIRNRRPNRLVAPAVFLGLGLFWIGVCVFLVVGQPERWPLVSGVVGVVLAIASCALAAWALTRDPVYVWKLGRCLSTWPGPPYSPAVIHHIDIGPDPHEDYVDADEAVAACEVAVLLRPRGSVRMIVSIGDARRLREWADGHGIPVRDPGSVLRGVNPD